MRGMTHREQDAFRIDVEERGGADGDFLRTVRRRIRHRRPDGTWSPPYQCDSVWRPLGMDAVAMVLHRRGEGGEVLVGLRTSRRPALRLDRPELAEGPPDGQIWEVPAGILEREDVGEAGRRRRCRLEALEEMGAEIPEEAFSPLGAPLWLSPGVIAERVHLYVAELPSAELVRPEGDGSPMEQDVRVAWIPLEAALGRCAEGATDAKTELALRRFAARTVTAVENPSASV